MFTRTIISLRLEKISYCNGPAALTSLLSVIVMRKFPGECREIIFLPSSSKIGLNRNTALREMIQVMHE